MTQYLPHSSKKLTTLQRRELALFKLIATDAPYQKIVQAAEAVRDARIRAIEARIASDGPRSGRNLYDDHIDVVRELSIDVILAYFGYVRRPVSDSPMSPL
ncbi:MAG: hypothetical protein KDB00_16440 [Planctomycetales bacterium]|nr:hypothetical protein [Planctomycetales bacterium]